MALSPLDDYIDGDVAYLLGLIVGRGTIVEGDQRRVLIEFPTHHCRFKALKHLTTRRPRFGA